MTWKAPQEATGRAGQLRDGEHKRVSQDFEARFITTQNYLNTIIQLINDSDLEIILPNPPQIAHPQAGTQIGGG